MSLVGLSGASRLPIGSNRVQVDPEPSGQDGLIDPAEFLFPLLGSPGPPAVLLQDLRGTAVLGEEDEELPVPFHARADFNGDGFMDDACVLLAAREREAPCGTPPSPGNRARSGVLLPRAYRGNRG